MKKYFIFIFVIIFSFSCSGNSRQINPIFSKELISVRKQSVVTHTELQNLNKTIKILDLEILRNKQNQLISLENLKDQIEKNLNFQVEIMENANSRLIEIEKEIKTIEKEEIQIEGPNITKEKLEFIKSRNYASVKKIEDLNLKFNDEKQLINQI